MVIELLCCLMWAHRYLSFGSTLKTKKKPVSAVRSVPYISALKRRSFTAPVVKPDAASLAPHR